MKISKDAVVSMHYTLKNDQGEVLDSSADAAPLVYLHGAGNIIPGLEEALEDKASGDHVEVSIAPEKGYGQRQDELVQVVSKEMFEGVTELAPGMQFQAQTPMGPQVVVVTAVEGDQVTVDGNHPLAGQSLHFEVDITDVREASAEELEHGHVHGPDGHEH